MALVVSNGWQRGRPRRRGWPKPLQLHLALRRGAQEVHPLERAAQLALQVRGHDAGVERGAAERRPGGAELALQRRDVPAVLLQQALHGGDVLQLASLLLGSVVFCVVQLHLAAHVNGGVEGRAVHSAAIRLVG